MKQDWWLHSAVNVGQAMFICCSLMYSIIALSFYSMSNVSSLLSNVSNAAFVSFDSYVVCCFIRKKKGSRKNIARMDRFGSCTGSSSIQTFTKFVMFLFFPKLYIRWNRFSAVSESLFISFSVSFLYEGVKNFSFARVYYPFDLLVLQSWK